MADLNEMLRKHQEKIEKAIDIGTTKPKKIDRDGEPMRPWHYALTLDTAQVVPDSELWKKENEPNLASDESGIEPEKFRKKTGNDSGIEPEKFRKKTGNDCPPNWKNTGSQTGNDSGIEPEKFRKNSGKIVVDEPRFSTLSGLQRQIIEFFYNESLRTPDKATPIFRLEYLGSVFQKTSHGGLESIRKSIYALQKKQLINREFSKHGPGGFTKYRLSDSVFNELRDLEIWKNSGKIPEKNWKNTGSQTGSQTGKVPPSSSSKDLDLNKLTNTGDAEVSAELPHEWGQIDTSPLIVIRFGRPQLLQLFRLGTLPAESVQESIYAFAFDLEVNGKSKEINGHALNYFMGILRKGPYAPPANYEAPEIRQMRLYLESKEREQKTREELENRIEAVEFDEWAVSLTVELKTQLVPPTDFTKLGSPGHNVQLKQYFRENIWPKRKENM